MENQVAATEPVNTKDITTTSDPTFQLFRQSLEEVRIEKEAFELALQKAEILSESSLVPEAYRNQPANIIIAMNIAKRLNLDEMMVMQSLYIVHGKPGWDAKFLVGMLNDSGVFSRLEYEFVGTEGQDDWGCYAVATENSTGKLFEGGVVDIALAKREGWYDKKGSKWKTMPEQMLRYRASTWFIRAYAPEIALGFGTREEAEDMIEGTVVSRRPTNSTGKYKAATLLPAPKEPEPEPESKTEPDEHPDVAKARQWLKDLVNDLAKNSDKADMLEQVAMFEADAMKLESLDPETRKEMVRWATGQVDEILAKKGGAA